MGQSSRDRSSSRDDKADDKEDEPEVIFEPAPAMAEAVAKGDTPEETPAPAEAPALSREEDMDAVLNRIAGELARLKATYGEPAARIIGERALTFMRRA